MMKFVYCFVLVALAAVASAIPAEEYQYQYDPEEAFYVYSPAEVVYELQRPRRSLQPGAPNLPGAPQQNGGWSVSPNVGRDDRGNTRTSINVGHKGKDHDFDAGWGKVVRGPGKAKPTWHVRGTYKW